MEKVKRDKPGRPRMYENNYEKAKAYRKKHGIQRITIFTRESDELNKEKIKAAADSEGMSVSQFVLRAVSAKMKGND